MGRAIPLLTSVALLAAMAGCSLCPHCRRGGTPGAGNGGEMPLAPVERADQEQEIRALAAAVQRPDPPDDPPLPTDYRALAPPLCQCLAVQHAPLADGLDNQRRRLENSSPARSASKGCPCSRCGLARLDKSAKQRAFQQSMLLYSALEIRNDAAGKTLEWYYQLAGAEAKADLLNNSLDSGRDLLAGAQRMKNLGIALPAPLEEYQRQIVEVQLQQAQNQLTIEQLNTRLREALGYGPHAWRFWPEPGIALGMEEPPDVEAAVPLGLAQRPQLLLLRSTIAHLDRDTLASARSFLQVLNPLLAMSSPGPSSELLAVLGKILHIQPGQEDEVERVRAQLVDYLHERERTVAAEIREAVYEIRARRQATLLARQAADSWEERIRDLKKQRAEGLRGVAELNKTYIEWYKARGVVVQELLGWKIAVVKLKMAQGILPAECGYRECH